jgi:hypothetical protein
MRRRLLWLGTLIVCVCVIAFVLLLEVGEPFPFEFLAGRSRVLLKATPAERRSVEQWNTFEVFSFESDFTDTVARADRELLKKGYHIEAGQIGFGGAPHTRLYEKSAPAVGSGKRTAAHRLVFVMDDTRFTSATRMYGPWPEGKDPGWLTVLVYGEGKRDLFSRIRDWFGL